MGNMSTIPSLATMEQIQQAIQEKNSIILNTLPLSAQSCLIASTLDASKEESTINELISRREYDRCIFIYGEHTHDLKKNWEKYTQLCQLGFQRVKVYPGGMFEWTLLQEIYGSELFPTTTFLVDLLTFSPRGDALPLPLPR